MSDEQIARLYKTRLCKWFPLGKCHMADKCNWAHGEADLRVVNDLTKTRMCPQGESCTNAACRFAHNPLELRCTLDKYKTKICNLWLMGSCVAGDACRHAHGEHDLRRLPETAAVQYRTMHAVPTDVAKDLAANAPPSPAAHSHSPPNRRPPVPIPPAFPPLPESSSNSHSNSPPATSLLSAGCLGLHHIPPQMITVNHVHAPSPTHLSHLSRPSVTSTTPSSLTPGLHSVGGGVWDYSRQVTGKGEVDVCPPPYDDGEFGCAELPPPPPYAPLLPPHHTPTTNSKTPNRTPTHAHIPALAQRTMPRPPGY